MSGDPRWLGYHLHAPEPWEPLLLECLAPALDAERRQGRLRRFFFLRYGEGGPHLRLRLLPRGGTDGDEVRRRLETRVGSWLGAGEWRLEAHPYDREELYFGAARESVYAELLNEATSELALRLLGAPGGESRGRRWLALAALLDVLLGGSTAGEDRRAAALAASRRFAREAAAAVGRPVAESSAAPPPPGAAAALAQARTGLGPALAAEPRVQRTARLLARARRCGPRGGLVAVHALHLLCNKLGLSLHEEHDLFTALARAGGG